MRRTRLIAAAATLVLALAPTVSASTATYFGLPHTCVGSATATPDPSGNVIISTPVVGDQVRIGVGTCDVAESTLDITSPGTPGELRRLLGEAELAGPGGTRVRKTMAELCIGDMDGDGISEICVGAPGGAIPPTLTVEAFLGGAVVSSVTHTPPPWDLELIQFDPAHMTFRLDSATELVPSTTITAIPEAPLTVTLAGAGGPVVADRVAIVYDYEPFHFYDLILLGTDTDDVILEGVTIGMFGNLHSVTNSTEMFPDVEAGRLTLLEGLPGDDVIVALRDIDDDDDSIVVEWDGLSPPGGTETMTLRRAVVSGGAPTAPVTAEYSGGAVTVDFSSILATSHQVEILSGATTVYSASDVTSAVVATLLGGEWPTGAASDLVVTAPGNSVQLTYRWRQVGGVPMLAGGGVYVGDELRVLAEVIPGVTLPVDDLEVLELEMSGIAEITLASPAGAVDAPTLGPAVADLALSVYPNPRRAGQSSRVRFAVPRPGRADLRVFDVSGRLVSTIHSELSSPGTHELTWTDADARGRPVGTGVYFVQVSTDAGRATRKVTVLR